jgi:Tol biopolymer transport system component
VTNEARQVIKIPRGGWAYAEPVFISPDGKQIAYGTSRRNPDRYELRVIGVDGSNDRPLAGTKDLRAIPQAWSPDGKYVITRFRPLPESEQVQTALVSVSDGSSRIISAGFLQSSRFSPDGRFIVFESPLESKHSDIFLLPVNGGRQVSLLENAGTLRCYPVWTSDGSRVLFLDDHRGARDLRSIRVVDGKRVGSPELIKDNLGYEELGAMPVGVSRNGDYYYNSTVRSHDLYLADIDPQTQKVTSQPRNVGRNFNALPAWSPDGEHLAYLSRRSPARTGRGYDVVIRSTKTGEEQVVVPKMSISLANSPPQWLSDSRSLLIYATPWNPASNYPADKNRLYRLDMKTNDLQPLSEPVLTAYSITLAPDGRSIYYKLWNQEARQTRIFQQELASNREKQLCVWNGWIDMLSVSRDGTRLAFVADERKLITLTAAGGEPKEVHLAPKGAWMGPPIWSGDGRRLFFVRDGTEIWSIPAEGGEPRSVGIGPLGGLWHLALRPDGKQLAFVLDQRKSEFWVLKNIFGELKASR